MALLEEYDVPIEGARAVVVGRSDIVGKPAALLLLHANATVTVCHSRTKDLAAHTREADILVVGVGQAGVIRPEHVREGATVIDVGMNRAERSSRRRRRPGSGGARGVDHPGPRRGRSDDDRDAPARARFRPPATGAGFLRSPERDVIFLPL